MDKGVFVDRTESEKNTLRDILARYHDEVTPLKRGAMEVASITGHKTLQVLKRYTHLRAEDLAKKLG